MSVVEESDKPNYEPTARRPIANLFRLTAHGAVRLCVRFDIHPDTVSYASVAAAALAAGSFWFADRCPILLIAAPLFCFLRLYFNMLDGMVALASGKASKKGEIVNELPDRFSDALIFVGAAHSGYGAVEAGYGAAIFALLTAYVGTLGHAIGGERQFGGIMSKPWRMVMLAIGSFVTYGLVMGESGIIHGGLTILDWACIAVMVGCTQTMFVRLRRMIAAL